MVLILFTACELPTMSYDQLKSIGNVFADYDQEHDQIFIMVELEGDWDIPGDTLAAKLNYKHSPHYYTICIDAAEASNYLSETLISSFGLCATPYQPVKGCLDYDAENFNEFAVVEDESCFYDPDSNWNHFQFGEFDWQTHSAELMVNHTHAIQNFTIFLSGLAMDSIVSYHEFSFPFTIDDDRIKWDNYSPSESLPPGTQKLGRLYFRPPPDYADGLDFILRDTGNNGDLIPLNNIFHAILPGSYFVPGTYTLTFPEIVDDSYEPDDNKLYLFHNFKPQIYAVEIPDTFHLDNDFTTYLTINVDVYEPNGYDDIKQVKFMVNTSQLTNEEFPDEGEDVFQSDPSWLFQYESTEGSDIYSYQTNIPMTAANSDGKTGKASFRFMTIDLSNAFNTQENIIQFERTIDIIKCGDQICNEGFEDSYSCSEDCADE